MLFNSVLAAVAVFVATANAQFPFIPGAGNQQQRCQQDNCVRFMSTGQVSAFCAAYTNNRWTYSELPTAYNACVDRAALSTGCACVFPGGTSAGQLPPVTTVPGTVLIPTTITQPGLPTYPPDSPNTPPLGCNPTFTVTRVGAAVTQTVYITGPAQTGPAPPAQTSITTVSSPSR